MNLKFPTTMGVACLLVAGAIAWAQTRTNDPTLDQVLHQQEKLLKNQERILKNQETILNNQAEMKESLQKLESGVNQLRRRGT